MRRARPARHGSATGFLSNPIATRWNSCSPRHGDAPASSYSISSWILAALPSLFSLPNFVQGRSPRSPIHLSKSRSASALLLFRRSSSSTRCSSDESIVRVNSTGSRLEMTRIISLSSSLSSPLFGNYSTAVRNVRTHATLFSFDERSALQAIAFRLFCFVFSIEL